MHRAFSKTALKFAAILVLAAVELAACHRLPSGEVAPVATVYTATPSPSPTHQPFSTPQPTLTPTLPPQMQVNLADLNGRQITFWHPWTGETAGLADDLVDQFNHTNLWGITVEAKSAGGENAIFEMVGQELALGDPLHVVAAPIEMVSAWQNQTTQFVDLNEYIYSSEWGFSEEELADFNRSFMMQDQSDGHQLGIPALRTLHVLFYNRSWAEDLGFNTAPTTQEEFQTQACAAGLARKEIDLTGGWVMNTDPLVTLSWLYGFGFSGIPETENDAYQFNNAKGRSAFNFLWQLSNQGCAWASREPQPHAYFANRQALFYSGTLHDILDQSHISQRLNSNDQWEILPYPSTDRPVAISSGPSYAILGTTYEEQLAAWLFIRWMVLPRNQAALAVREGAIPSSASALELMGDFRQDFPQWDGAIPLVPLSQPAPGLASWHRIRSILQDATWQMFQTNTTRNQIPSILTELDTTIPEVLQN